MKRPAILSLVLAGLLAACSSIVTYHSVPADSSYHFPDIERAVRNGALYADVVGNPFGVGGSVNSADFRERVREMMTVDVAGVPIRFVGKTSPHRAADYRVVVWFNPTQNPRTVNLCTYMGGVAVSRDPDRLDVAMALCAGDALLTRASGVVYKVQGERSPLLRQLISTVTEMLFPQISGDPERSNQ